MAQQNGQDLLRYQGVHTVIGLGFGRSWAANETPGFAKPGLLLACSTIPSSRLGDGPCQR